MSQDITGQGDFEPRARPVSRRIAFCPTCNRPFLHGNGVYQDSCIEAPLMKEGQTPAPAIGQSCPEYCSEKCLPGVRP